MATITEDYVSFETAKLLKERGFNERCRAFRSPSSIGTKGLFYSVREIKNTEEKKTLGAAIACPTLQMAMKWLREVYNLHIITLPYAPIDRPPYHPGEADIVYIGQIFKGIIPIDKVGRSIIKLSPEETYEVAIKYCLEKLI